MDAMHLAGLLALADPARAGTGREGKASEKGAEREQDVVELDQDEEGEEEGSSDASVLRVGAQGGSLAKWDPSEDMLLVHLVNQHGTKQWNIISTLLPGRTGKQCR